MRDNDVRRHRRLDPYFNPQDIRDLRRISQYKRRFQVPHTFSTGNDTWDEVEPDTVEEIDHYLTDEIEPMKHARCDFEFKPDVEVPLSRSDPLDSPGHLFCNVNDTLPSKKTR